MNMIGVVGQIAVGKGILVDYLVKKFGFTSFSLSSVVHEELHKRGVKEFTRETLQDIGDELRKRYGDDILAKRAIEKISNFTSAKLSASKFQIINCVIEGIRNPAEIEYLKTFPNFVLIGVKAKRELRFERLVKRNKPWDPKTWDEFVAIDRRDLGVRQDKSGNQVGKCLHYCDYVLTNNKDMKDLERKVEKLIALII